MDMVLYGEDMVGEEVIKLRSKVSMRAKSARGVNTWVFTTMTRLGTVDRTEYVA